MNWLSKNNPYLKRIGRKKIMFKKGVKIRGKNHIGTYIYNIKRLFWTCSTFGLTPRHALIEITTLITYFSKNEPIFSNPNRTEIEDSSIQVSTRCLVNCFDINFIITFTQTLKKISIYSLKSTLTNWNCVLDKHQSEY